jgi:anti-sigma factor RsiW
MTQRDLNAEWARTQLEAWADGSLNGESRERMESAIAADPRLKLAAERARAVRRALRASPAPPMPRGLRRRLLAIPNRTSAGRSFALPAFAGVAAAAALVAGALWWRLEPAVQVDPRMTAAQEATEEVELAMRYLQKSARVTQGHVTNAVGSGLRDAFAASRAALAQNTDETGG